MSKIKSLNQEDTRNHLSKPYENEPKLCVVKHVKTYINRTANLRKSKKLLISYIKHHKEVFKDTVSRF